MKPKMELEIKGIKKQFHKKTPLADITFSVEKGSCVGILGKNGSGKSTLLSILAGVQKCDAGEFIFQGENLFKNRKKLANQIGYVPQGTPLLEELTAWDNLLLWYEKEDLKKELENGVLAMLGIQEFIKVPVCKMSGGMKKRLSIGCSVAKHPSVLLLDEPSAALDLIAKDNIASYLREFKKNGGTLLLTTHDEAEFALCDKIYILKDGYLKLFEGDIHRLAVEL